MHRRSLSVALVTLGLGANVACSGRSVTADGSIDQATPGQTDLAPNADSGGRGQLAVAPFSPPPDDNRLQGFAEGNPGNTPNGWDWCEGGRTLRRGPGDCVDCPPSPTGTTYMRYTGSIPFPPCGAGTAIPCPAEPGCQIYAYFDPPLVANETLSLWFDLAHVAGDSFDATLTIDATGPAAETLETLGTWGLAYVLPGPSTKWITTCAYLKPSVQARGIGFHFRGAQVDLGMTNPRFGPPCTLL